MPTSPWWCWTRHWRACSCLCSPWDWRSPFYLQKAPTPAQPQVIDFLKSTAWVDFIIEYHKQSKFVGLLPAAIPDYPIFDRKHTLP